MLHHICCLLFSSNSCIHGDKARPYTNLDRQCFPENSKSLMEPIVFSGLNIHIDGIEKAVTLIPAFLLDSCNQSIAFPKKLLCLFLFSKLAVQLCASLKLYAHKAVQINICSGKWRASKSCRVIVHTDHNIILPYIQPTVFVEIIVIITVEIFRYTREKLLSPAVISCVITDQAHLAAKEGLMHIHNFSFFVSHIQIRLRPVCNLDHHRNVSVFKLMIKKVADISLCMLYNSWLHRRILIRIRQIQEAVYGPVGIPVPYISIINRAWINKWITDKASRILQHILRVRHYKFFQFLSVLLCPFIFHNISPLQLLLSYLPSVSYSVPCTGSKAGIHSWIQKQRLHPSSWIQTHQRNTEVLSELSSVQNR